MTVYGVKIDYDLSELKKLTEQFAKTVENAPEAALPNTAKAFKEASEAIRNMWADSVSQIPGATSKMVESIKSDRLGDFHYQVWSNNRQLEQLDKGSPAVEYDMKKTHPYGNKSRVSKKGIPYLIIPFRWATPNSKGGKRAHFNNFIPQKNYNTALKGLEISAKNALKNYFEKNFRGENIERQGYDWAKFGRLTDDQAWEVKGKRENTYTSAGMVRMLDDRQKDVRDSTYFTFRIISAKSPAGSWIYHKDAEPGTNYFAKIEQEARRIADEKIRAGIAADDRS